MCLFSSLFKGIFIISLAFSLYSETAFSRSQAIFPEPECSMYEEMPSICTKEFDPVCATNGKTYGNPCVFCNEMIKSQRTVGFRHYGYC